jgi:hypothetical protein
MSAGSGSFTALYSSFNGGAFGTSDVCRNSQSHEITHCSSSLRYKADVKAFNGGLDIVRRLRPITFDWIRSGIRDVGFGAEEVAEIEPLFVEHNQQGEIEGVKYKLLTTVLVNAVKEQQAQIDAQKNEIDAQRAEIADLKQKVSDIDQLKKLVCQQSPKADICKDNK